MSTLEKTMWCLDERGITVKLMDCFNVLLILLSENKVIKSKSQKAYLYSN